MIVASAEIKSEIMRSILEKAGPGSDAGAYLVPHCKGIADEVALLRRAIGENADAELVRAESEVRRRFRRSA